MRTLLGLLTSLSLAAGSALAGAPVAAAQAVPMPSGRLEFGVSNFDAGWLTSTGVPWKYRYQYLAAGVNTGNGWATWNSPPGQFVTNYVQATPPGTIPVLTYYMLLQSNPSLGPGEAERDFSNLNNPSTMSAYYADFKLLMQRLGAETGPAVVHVEPDLWGYLQQQAGTGDASSLTASVAGSGFAEAASYPDTVRGFAQTLLHLRDIYAPRLVMAIHSSMWSSKRDLATDPDPALDPRTEADKTAAFLASTGNWDAVFNDVDDHDAAWWELVGGQPNHWWDPLNQRLPNFRRYLTWVSELKARTGLPQVVWQVPVGNQYFLTENNTCGHYQDVVAEYFLNHPQELFNAGLVAVLFGAGNSCQTTPDDSQHDGITNNGGQPTSDLAGGCRACNTHAAQYPDDDGGFLRTFVGAYYAALTPAPQVFAGGGFNPVTPRRVLDTRDGTGRRGSIGAGQSFDLDLSSQIPSGATSVTLNVTVTGPTGSGYLTVWPAGTARPVASNLNFVAGQTVANLVEVAVGSTGRVSFYSYGSATDVVADLSGYTAPAGYGFTGAAPARLLDTRVSGQTLGPGQALTLNNLPAGADAVVVNLTAVNPSSGGYLTAWPASQPRPLASNLNFEPGDTVANRVVVPSAGGLSIFNSAGSTDLVVDLAGYFGSAGASFTGVTPTRILDTRSSGQTLGVGATLNLQIAGGTVVPASARVVVLNLTATDTVCCGYLTVWPAGLTRPTASDLNYTAGATVPNLVVAQLGSGGSLSIYNGPGGADVIVDVLGWYS